MTSGAHSSRTPQSRRRWPFDVASMVELAPLWCESSCGTSILSMARSSHISVVGSPKEISRLLVIPSSFPASDSGKNRLRERLALSRAGLQWQTNTMEVG